MELLASMSDILTCMLYFSLYQIDKEKPEDLTDVEIMKDGEREKPLDPFIEEDTDELRIEKEDEWHPQCVDKIKQITEQHKFLAG